jgi:hypothetical protein
VGVAGLSIPVESLSGKAAQRKGAALHATYPGSIC